MIGRVCGLRNRRAPQRNPCPVRHRPPRRRGRYSASVIPEPPISLGMSLSFGLPSRIGSTLS